MTSEATEQDTCVSCQSTSSWDPGSPNGGGGGPRDPLPLQSLHPERLFPGCSRLPRAAQQVWGSGFRTLSLGSYT